jgi:hypothetical protein
VSFEIPIEARTIVVSRDLWEALVLEVAPAGSSNVIFDLGMSAKADGLTVRVDDNMPKGSLLAYDAAGNIIRLAVPPVKT